jgi:Tfp pilus assembly protein PilE
VAVVTAIIAVMTSVSVPSFRRSMERARADLAAARLQSVWAAQQLYWLENHTYAASLSTLSSAGLIDGSLTSSQQGYLYQIASASATSFSATAARQGSSTWSGTLAIDQTCTLTGSISAAGLPSIVPKLN